MKDTSDEMRGEPRGSAANRRRSGVLRFLTCGSVDDGKSTLIGRLLLDSAQVFDDHVRALARDSCIHGTVARGLDAALLLDGLEAEREQGITIDVAFRYFETPRRRFIVADTPGHVQYTRNMVTGASTASLAVLLVDATKGISEQTRRHAVICSLLGIRDVMLAVNKMDLVEFGERVYSDIVQGFSECAKKLNLRSIATIPVSARFGDNIINRSPCMPWYQGPSLLDHLETVDIAADPARPFRFPVQWVNRPNSEFRGYAGTIASGEIRPGDPIQIARSGVRTRVARLVTMDGDLEKAAAGESITLTLADDVDISRGDMISTLVQPSHTYDAFAAHVVWMAEAPLFPGRDYLLKCGPRTVVATVTELKHRIEVTSLANLAAKVLRLNEIGVVNVATHEPIAIDPFDDNRDTGSFILIDRASNTTVAAGMIRHALYRASNLRWQSFDVNKRSRAALNKQRPIILWFTGLPGAGKSTIANILEKKLHSLGKHTYLLDGDNIRHGINRDLGFAEADRVENIRRIGEIAKLFVDAGLITLVAFISPFRAERRMARELVEQGEFVEIFVDTPLELCKERDPKGLYGKAQRGELRNLTGVDSPYEPPEDPELRLDTSLDAADALADQVMAFLRKRGVLD